MLRRVRVTGMLTLRWVRVEVEGRSASRERFLRETSNDIGQLVDFFGQVLRVFVGRSRTVIVDSGLYLIVFRIFFRRFLFHHKWRLKKVFYF